MIKGKKNSTETTFVTSTGRLACVGIGSGNHPNSRKNLKPAKKRAKKQEFEETSWEDFYGGSDMYEGPFGPLEEE